MWKDRREKINITLSIIAVLGLSLLLCLPEICYTYYNAVNGWRLLCTVLLSFFGAYSVTAIPSKSLKLTLVVFIWLLSFAELLMLVSFYSYLTGGEIVACVCGTKNEWLMLLSFFWTQNKIWWCLAILLLVTVIFCVLKASHNFPKWYVNALVIGVMSLFLLLSPVKLREIIPLTTCYNIGCAIDELVTMQRKKDKIHISYPLHREKSPGSELYVMAIGESLRYHNLGLNGKYERQTTPLLSQIRNLTLYSDCYSSGVLTQYSLPLLLSSATAANFEAHYEEERIGMAFTKMGYDTYIVSHSNQCTNDGVHAYLRYGFDSIVYVLEDSLIAPCILNLARNKEKVFILTHYQGNHFFYANRTPEYGKWQPDFNDNPFAQSDSLFVNAYDNSVLYADYILSQTIKALDTTNRVSSIVFISDHGDYFDERIAVHGHTYHPTKEEYHVPLMVWYSDEYKAAYPDKIANMIRHKDEPVCADHVFWSVLDMAGIRIDSTLQQDGMSIFGDTLLPHQRTLLLPDGKSVMNLD